ALAFNERNGVHATVLSRRRAIIWEADGIESSVALDARDALSLQVNGKSDGHSTYDGPTQVMLGLVAAITHPNPKRALVVGLGTGETAGWLAQIPSIDAVDVFELEPAVVHLAAECAIVNENAPANPHGDVILVD